MINPSDKVDKSLLELIDPKANILFQPIFDFDILNSLSFFEDL